MKENDGNVTVVTPLYYAIIHGSTEVVRSLLASGARQDLDTGVIIIIAPLSTNVTPVTQDHFYSINAIKTMTCIIICHYSMPRNLTGKFNDAFCRPTDVIPIISSI